MSDLRTGTEPDDLVMRMRKLADHIALLDSASPEAALISKAASQLAAARRTAEAIEMLLGFCDASSSLETNWERSVDESRKALAAFRAAERGGGT
jgi:hypothetical protein